MSTIEEIRFVKRIVVGSIEPDQPPSESQRRDAIDLLNRCLHSTPRGQIIGIEKQTAVVSAGDQQAIAQTVVYHVGFTRRPTWLPEGLE
jgi:hypothetical protein